MPIFGHDFVDMFLKEIAKDVLLIENENEIYNLLRAIENKGFISNYGKVGKEFTKRKRRCKFLLTNTEISIRSEENE